ncbi:CDP-alcohol phosphatidyltransferase family protein [bacterium]|nr:CDP-alcohol phosphatidyltransferase family protein [bacterium]
MKSAVPNLLTLSRLVLLPLGLYFLFEANYLWAFGTYIFIAFTDYWDGFLARKWGVCSSWGVVLDQISDKCVGLGFFFGLAQMNLCPLWFPILLLLITLFLGIGYLFTQVLAPHPGPQPSLRLGKWSTALQYIWVGWLLLHRLASDFFLSPPNLAELNQWGFLLLAVLQIWVFIQYTKRLLKDYVHELGSHHRT